ncbi:hypothetical protein MW887_006848 [Aspergillus wentii]|nr:hypothetical protein MW887_006848 [Aspergillus wentii]
MPNTTSSIPFNNETDQSGPVNDESTKHSSRSFKRSRSGCFTCRVRRKKCDEGRPACSACTKLCVSCEYTRPAWWATHEQRRLQKERIKEKIRRTKVLERDGSLQDYMARITARFRRRSPATVDRDLGHHALVQPYDDTPLPAQTPYEVDIRTEHQTFVDNVPYRNDSYISRYSSVEPLQYQDDLSTSPSDEWFREYFNHPQSYSSINPVPYGHANKPLSSYLQTVIPVDEHDRPLLDHFLNNVLRLVFPVLDVHRRGPARAREILHSLEMNKSYLHCCLSVSAIHLKTTMGLSADQIDDDIMRHRYEAVSQLCRALGHGTDHEQILDATLAMIFFHCSVGAPDDYLPDIPWNAHFQAISNLVGKLNYEPPPFSMSLIAWIDILGATMLGTTPQFAHAYRARHMHGTSSGLRELMGCDDRVMYLISEIACLDGLKTEGRLDELTLCQHITALSKQLDYTEPIDPTLERPSSASGVIRPEQLTKAMSALFRTAARIYLCSLTPGFNHHQPSTVDLVADVADILCYIPMGPYGFDRSLVWTLLITGAYSLPSSSFRDILAERAEALGDLGDFGSFGRMYRLLQELWRRADEDPITPSLAGGKTFADSNLPYIGTPLLPSPPRKEPVHWRDVMKQNKWGYLLM